MLDINKLNKEALIKYNEEITNMESHGHLVDHARTDYERLSTSLKYIRDVFSNQYDIGYYYITNNTINGIYTVTDTLTDSSVYEVKFNLKVILTPDREITYYLKFTYARGDNKFILFKYECKLMDDCMIEFIKNLHLIHNDNINHLQMFDKITLQSKYQKIINKKSK